VDGGAYVALDNRRKLWYNALVGKSAYKSCNCRICRAAPSRVKGWHKRTSHRALRHLTRRALRSAAPSVVPDVVSSGYKS
jgi:hypothetical protein